MSFTTLSLQTRPRPRQAEQRFFQPLVENAFRVLGLSAAASEGEIHAAASAASRALKLGVERARPCDLPWLGPVVRTEMTVRDALSRLANPAQRIYERLFWFGAEVPGDAVESFAALDTALEAMLAGESPSARHDAALLALAVAFGLDARLRVKAAWTRAFALWREVVDADEFWSSLVAADLKGEFEQLVTHGEVRDLRRRALRLVTAPVANAAKDAVAHNDPETCRRALDILRDAPLPDALVAEYENDILGPVEDGFDSMFRQVFTRVRNLLGQPQYAFLLKGACHEELSGYDWRVRPRLKTILAVAGARSFVTRRAFGATASALNDVANGYGEAGEQRASAAVRRKAWALAPPGSAALLQIEEDFKTRGGGEAVRARTEAEYFDGLAAELREPLWEQTGLTAPSAAATAGQPATLSGFGSFLFIVLCVAAGVICAWSGGGSSRRSGSLGPRGFDYRSYNFNVPRYEPPPLPQFDMKGIVFRVSAGDLRRKSKRRGGVVVFDVRAREEYRAGHVPGALSVPEDEVEKQAAKFSKDKEIVIYCASPAEASSAGAAVKLMRQGYWRVHALRGGYDAWVEAGLPVSRAK